MMTQAAELVVLERAHGELPLAPRTQRRRRIWIAGREFSRQSRYDFDSDMTR